MGKETKIGLVVVAIVAVFFGAFVVQRARRPEPEAGVAKNTAPQGETGQLGSDLLESPPVVVETGGFSGDLSPDLLSGHESNDLSDLPDEGPLEVPLGPGTGVDDTYNGNYNSQFSNVPIREYNNSYPENETVAEPSQWSTRHDTAEVEPLDEVPLNDPGTSQLTGSAFEHEALPDDPSSTENASWAPSSAPQTQTQSQTLTNRGASHTLVDDARSSAGFEESTDVAPDLFEGVEEELMPATTSPVVEALAPRNRLPTDSLDTDQWIVREGDSFWSISRQVYGTGRYFKALARWNEKTVPDPGRMRTGTVLETPPLSLLEQADPELVSQRQARSTPSLPGLEGLAVPEQAGGFAGPLGRKYYLVGRTDTLFDISKKTLGRGGRWKELFELNGDILEDPHRLAPGMILRLPSSAAVEVFLSSRPESGVIR